MIHRRRQKHRVLTNPGQLGDMDEVLGAEAALPWSDEPQIDTFIRRVVAAKVIDCLDAIAGTSDVHPDRAEEDDLIQWVSDDATAPWSLRWCLDVLGLDVGRYRDTLRQLWHERCAREAGELPLGVPEDDPDDDPADEDVDSSWVEHWRVGGAVQVVR